MRGECDNMRIDWTIKQIKENYTRKMLGMPCFKSTLPYVMIGVSRNPGCQIRRRMIHG